MRFRFPIPRRMPLPRRSQLWNRGAPRARQRPDWPASSPTSARVSARTKQLTQEADVLWWRWRHLFLEAKRLELAARSDEGREAT